MDGSRCSARAWPRCARCRRPSASFRYAGLSRGVRTVRGIGADRDDIRIVAGLSALVFAVNLVTIKYSREARMYPLMLAAILAQVAMFLRALRVGGFANYAAVVLLTAIAIASNFAAMLIPATEGLWLVYMIARAGWRPGNANARRAWAIAIALAAGGLILLPKLFLSMHAASSGSVGGWRKPPAWYEPFALFNKATGSFAFPILAILAIWGVIRGWRRGARDSIAFAMLWMWAPPLDNGRRVVRDCAGLRRALRAVVLRSVLHPRRVGNLRVARRSRARRRARCSRSHSRSAISFRTIASRTTRSIAKRSPPPIPRSSRARS